jgi:diguanylate cyclase (GGDEF)-like protein
MSVLGAQTGVLNLHGVAEIDRLNGLAWGLVRNDLKQALGHSQRALELAQHGGYGLGEARALRTRGVCQYLKGEYEAAFADLAAAQTLAHEAGDSWVKRDCHNYTGALYTALGELERALEYVEKTYWLCVELGDQGGIAFSLNNMGHIFDKLGRFEDGLKAKLESLEISRRNHDQPREATAWGNVVNGYIQLERFAEAVGSGLELIDFCRQHGFSDVLVRTLVNLGEAYTGQQQYPQALEVLTEAHALVQAAGIREGEVYCNLNIAGVYLAQNLPAQALVSLKSALEIAQALGAKTVESEIHLRLADAYEAMGYPAQALEHYKTHHRLEKTLGAELAERKLRIFSVQRELEQAQAEAQIAHLKNVELKQALEELEQAHRENMGLMQKLAQKSQELEVQVVQDPLTHLYNRRYLETVLEREFLLAQQTRQPLPVAMLDVDNFKCVNDSFSHQVGDQVLIQVAQILLQCLRSSDTAARFGGEEFVVMLPQISPENALMVCERIRKAVEGHEWAKIHPQLSVTISIGLASNSALSNQEKLLSAADEMLYAAKRSGKNKVCC